MSDLRLESSQTMDEIVNNFKDTDFFSGIMDGLEEALAHKSGKLQPKPWNGRDRFLPMIPLVILPTLASKNRL